MATAAERAELTERINAIDWYHTLELEPGLLTPGWFDTRRIVDKVPLPADLSGKRCLDVGSFDGFWAFEMERRGADEVLAIDVRDPRQWDWPLRSPQDAIAAVGRRKGRGEGFEIARRALGSAVEHHEVNVYDLAPDSLGQFDFVYLGSLLIHLRDPVRALERVRSVTSGTLVVVDNVDLVLSLLHPRKAVAFLDGRDRPWWWRANSAALARMVEAGGFKVLEAPQRFFMPPGPGQRLGQFSLRLLASREGREALVIRLRGDPHAALRALPS